MKVFLSDGRALRYWNGGTDGPVVLVFHGCPDTRRIAMTGAKAAYDAGVRLLAFNRPGYGSSTPAASTHTSVASDAAELLDLWGIDRVAVLGMSVGGSYAAAFAATYPDRVTAMALVSAQGNTVTDTEGTVEDAVERMRPEFMDWRAKIDPDDEDDAALAARFLAELPAADAALAPRVRRRVRRLPGLRGAGEAGGLPPRRGPAVPRRGTSTPSAVRCPTTVWCGELDDNALSRRALVGRAACRRHDVDVLPGTTHLATLLTQWPAILRRLRSGGTATG